MRSWIAIAFVVVACGGGRRAWQPIPSNAPLDAAFALVPLAAPLFDSAEGDAPPIVLGSRGVAAYRAIREQGRWVEIETLGGPSPGQCAPQLPALHGLRLRFFVPATGLALATSREVEQRFNDGTSIALRRGVPVEPLPDGAFRLGDDGMAAILRLSPADVSTRYLPSVPFDTTTTPTSLPGEVLAAGVPILGMNGHVAAAPIARAIYASHSTGAEEIVELHTPCMRLELRVPAHAVAEVEAPARTEVAPVVEGLFVEARAALYWRDGRSAGESSERTTLGEEVEPSGERRCFTRSADETRLTICVARREVLDPSGQRAANLLDPP